MIFLAHQQQFTSAQALYCNAVRHLCKLDHKAGCYCNHYEPSSIEFEEYETEWNRLETFKVVK